MILNLRKRESNKNIEKFTVSKELFSEVHIRCHKYCKGNERLVAYQDSKNLENGRKFCWELLVELRESCEHVMTQHLKAHFPQSGPKSPVSECDPGLTGNNHLDGEIAYAFSYSVPGREIVLQGSSQTPPTPNARDVR